MGLGDKLKGVFWSSGGQPTAYEDENAAGSALDSESETGSVLDSDADAGGRAGATSSAPPTTDVLSADFPAIYAGMNAVGDSNVDSLLAAYAQLASMEESARRAAFQAVFTATKANPVAIVSSLEKRLNTLRFVFQEQDKAREKNRSDRAKALQEKQAGTERQIAELQEKIAQLGTGLDELHRSVARADEDAEAKVHAFRQRVEVETSRLNDLLTFLKGMIPQTKGK